MKVKFFGGPVDGAEESTEISPEDLDETLERAYATYKKGSVQKEAGVIFYNVTFPGRIHRIVEEPTEEE